MRRYGRTSRGSSPGQGPGFAAVELRGSSGGSAKGILIAVVLACLLIAGGVGLWLHGRPSQGTPSTATKADLAKSVAIMTPDQKQQAYQNEVNALQTRGTQLQNYLDSFPKPLTDLDALAQSLTTPQAALQYVRDQIALEPYPGVLKGALGTLLTRGGNDLDRALLLAALLKQQGVDCKIAHGTISAAQAQSLLQQIVGAPDAVDQIGKTLPKTAPPAGGDSEDEEAFHDAVNRRRKELNDAVDQTFQQLQSALKTAGVALGQDATARQLDSLEDHYWVQATIDDKSVDLDPSSATAQLGQSLCTAAETLDADSLPDKLYQRLKFRVVAEHLQSGQVRATEVLAQEVNSVDLLGKNIRLAIEPESLSANVNHFRAVLTIGDNTTAGQAFSLRPETATRSSTEGQGLVDGQSSDAGAAGGGMAGMGGLGGGGLGGGGGANAPANPPPPPAPSAASVSGHGEPVLGRLFLEVVSTGPHLVEADYRRVVMDRLAANGDKQQLFSALADDRSIRPLLAIAWDGAIAVGPFHPVYAFQAGAAALAAQEPLEEKVRAKFYLGEDVGDDDVPAPTLSAHLINYFLSSDLARHSFRRKAAPHARSYYERPRLAFERHGFVVRDWSKPGAPVRYLEGIDLINSPFGFLGPAEETTSLAMKAGIADTFLERHFRAGGATSNALPLLSAATSQGVALVTVRPGDRAGLSAVAVPAPVQSVLQEDVKSGSALLAPARLVSLNGGQQFGWWSIDASTGFSLGRMNLGGSQGMVESAEINQRITKWTETFAKFYGNVLKCYMGAVGDALGSVGTDDNLNFQVTLNHGEGSPTPSAEQVSDCLIDAACDALGDLIGEETGDAAADEAFVEGLDQVAGEVIKKQLAGAGGKSAGKVCTGLAKKGLGD